MENIAIVGASGQAKVVIDILEKTGKYIIAGILDYKVPKGSEILGYPVLGKEEDLPVIKVDHSINSVIIAIGDNHTREKVASKIKAICPGMGFGTAIHPDTSIGKDVTIGEGTVIMAGARINPCSRIGSFCVLNTNCSLDHDCIMQDYSSLAPNASTGGNCLIGEYSAICIGASLIHGIEIGQHSVIGAGATVNRDIPSYKLAYGTPARLIRERIAGDKYM